MAHLRKTVHTAVLETLFPYAPESVVVTNTAYKPCNDSAPAAGITRQTNNAQLKSVLNSLKTAGLLDLVSIDKMAEASGSKAADSVSQLARMIRDSMQSGQRVVLGDLWENLQKPPFGYYNTIACGVLLGYVFSCYKDSAYSWTDNAQSTHVLGENTLKTMVLNMCKGTMTTDYLSAGSVTFQNYREYVKRILHLTDAQVANETECWHNMREAVTKAGAPLWTLKFLPDMGYGGSNYKDAAMKIIDSMQQFIAQEGDREAAMNSVLQEFNGRGKLRSSLEKAFHDKNVMNTAFRTFLFTVSPELNEIATRLSVQPEELSDKLHMVMQNAIYTWTEDQVKEKLPDVVSDYSYLDTLNGVMGKVYHSTDSAKRDLVNVFKFLRISLAAIKKTNVAWYPALEILHRVSQKGTAQMTAEERSAEVEVLKQHGQKAYDCLKDAKLGYCHIVLGYGGDTIQSERRYQHGGLQAVLPVFS